MHGICHSINAPRNLNSRFASLRNGNVIFCTSFRHYWILLHGAASLGHRYRWQICTCQPNIEINLLGATERWFEQKRAIVKASLLPKDTTNSPPILNIYVYVFIYMHVDMCRYSRASMSRRNASSKYIVKLFQGLLLLQRRGLLSGSK